MFRVLEDLARLGVGPYQSGVPAGALMHARKGL